MPRKSTSLTKTTAKQGLKQGVTVQFVKTTPTAKAPTYGTEGAGAFDFYSNVSMTVPPRGVAKIPLGVKVAIPPEYMMLIIPRSSIGAKTPLRLSNSIGLIDSDYRGEVMALYENKPDAIGSRTIADGDRVAQGFLIPKVPVTFTEVDKLEETKRSDGGFGSTGR